MLKAILFDLDDTLLAWRGVEATALQQVCQLLNGRFTVPDDTILHKRVASVLHENRSQLNTGQIKLRDISDQLSNSLSEVGIPSELAREVVPRCLSIFANLVRPFEDCCSLDELKDNYKLGIVTNGPSELQRLKIDICGLSGLFHLVLCSADIGICKPDAAIFDHALAQLEVEPEEAIMIGNNLKKDVIAPRSLGMESILLDRYHDADGTWTGTRIRSLHELSGVLQELSGDRETAVPERQRLGKIGRAQSDG